MFSEFHSLHYFFVFLFRREKTLKTTFLFWERGYSYNDFTPYQPSSFSVSLNCRLTGRTSLIADMNNKYGSLQASHLYLDSQGNMRLVTRILLNFQELIFFNLYCLIVAFTPSVEIK